LFYDELIVNFTVLELLPEEFSLLTMSLLRVIMVKMPTGVVVLGFMPRVNFLLRLPQGSLLQL
jgi:hypothetical protein